MKSAIKRLEELEKKRPVNKEPQFVCWGGQEWTQEEKEMMKRKYPAVKIFWKPLSKTPPYGLERQGKEAVELFNDLANLVNWDPEVVKKRDEKTRRSIMKEYPMRGNE